MNLHLYGYHLVQAYNERHGTDYDPPGFFASVAAPLLFDDAGDALHVSNSPFFQKKRQHEGAERVEAALTDLREKITAGRIDGAIVPGGPAKNRAQATASGLTDVDFGLTPKDGYAAWLGLACGMTVSRGFTLFDQAACLPLFEGWPRYRAFVAANAKMKWRQLPTWNAYWIVDEPEEGVPPVLDQHSNSTREIQTCPWHLTMMALARLSDTPRTLFITKYGQTNTTVGYVPFAPRSIRRLYDLYAATVESNRPLFQLIGQLKVHFSMRQVATLGQIGLEAFRPARLLDDDLPDDPAFHTAWILLMLDNDALRDTAETAATQLRTYAEGATRDKTNRSNDVDRLLEASTKTQFATALERIVDEVPDPAYRELMNAALDVPDTQFRLFTRLIAIYYKTTQP